MNQKKKNVVTNKQTVLRVGYAYLHNMSKTFNAEPEDHDGPARFRAAKVILIADSESS